MLQGVILGSAASKPSAERNPSSIFIRAQGTRILLDCGQGTQQNLLRYAPEFFVDVIVISHHHTDHDHGLKPYVETMGLLDREEPLYIYTPEPNKVQKALELTRVRYEVIVLRMIPGIDFVHGKLSLCFFLAKHSVPCMGVRIESLEKTRYDRAKLLELDPVDRREMFTESTRASEREAYRLPDCPRYSLYYSGDTVWDPAVLDRVHAEGLIIHECTFTKAQDHRLARSRHHTHLSEIAMGGRSHILTHIGDRQNQKYLERSKPLNNGIWAYDGLKFVQRIW